MILMENGIENRKKSTRNSAFAEGKGYAVLNANQAREIAALWLQRQNLTRSVSFGLPEIQDRTHIWIVPLVSDSSKVKLGEVAIDARTSLIDETKTTRTVIIEARLLNRIPKTDTGELRTPLKGKVISEVRNTIVCGDAESVIQDFPSESVDLVFTSPPYLSAKPQYTEYVSYEEYLLKMRRIIHEIHRTLKDGKFFVMNVSPILIKRSRRQESSRRIAIPFDLHRIFTEEGYEFVDDIIWVKPDGAGWALGRGRRFAADRNPMQYKPAVVTEYVLVYRKKSDKLIDYYIRHTDQKIVEASKILGEYDRTNVWKIPPAHDSKHPAVFPIKLAEKVIRYYSFKNDVVLDPFAGLGTTGLAAINLSRRFIMIEINPEYVNETQSRLFKILGKNASSEVLLVNTPQKNLDNFFVNSSGEE